MSGTPHDEPEIERCLGDCKICDGYDRLGLGHHPGDSHHPDHYATLQHGNETSGVDCFD